MDKIEENISQFDCWRGAGSKEIDEASEAIEYFLTKRLYKDLFAKWHDIILRDD